MASKRQLTKCGSLCGQIYSGQNHNLDAFILNIIIHYIDMKVMTDHKSYESQSSKRQETITKFSRFQKIFFKRTHPLLCQLWLEGSTVFDYLQVTQFIKKGHCNTIRLTRE